MTKNTVTIAASDARNVILAIETATSSCSVALSANGQTYTCQEVGNNVHSKVLLSMVRDVLAQAQLTTDSIDAVAVGQGPGSFTGLRIGVGVAQGIAYGVGVDMLGISSLDALANQATNQAFGPSTVIAAVDARMGELYWCEYQKTDSGVERIGELKVSAPQDLCTSQAQTPVQLLGNAWGEYQGQFSDKLMQYGSIDENQVYPMADALLELAQSAFDRGELISAIEFAPEYVRNNVAKKSTKKPF